mgnify:CR=1 FL=1
MENFIVGNYIDINGTSLRGYVPENITYDDIVEKLGEPEYIGPPGCDKVQAQWSIEFSDGEAATIYDYKNYSKHFTHHSGDDWHIGGRHVDIVQRVHEILKNN